MDAADVQSLVHDVIVHYGMPFTVLSVSGSSGGWDVLVRGETGGAIPFTVVGGRPVDLRQAIQRTLEARL
jgi:hypothetical protein